MRQTQRIPETVLGVGYTRDRGGLPLEAVRVAVPQPAADQVLIRVAASSLNPLEYKLADLNFMGQAMRRFGSRVTIVQRGPRLLEREDADVADALRELMTEEAVEVLLQTEVRNVTGRSGAGVAVRVHAGAEERDLEASDILVATGRTPNTDRLDAAKARVELDSRGYVRVNERLQTTAPDVWATGECAGSPQFTHVGEDDCRIVLNNLAGGNRTTRGRLIPYCLFTDPELAHVGLTESEARAKDVPYSLARGASWFLGASEWLFAALLFWGFWNKKAGILGDLGCCLAMVGTVTTIPLMPDGWDAAAGFPAMKGNVAFLLSDPIRLPQYLAGRIR